MAIPPITHDQALAYYQHLIDHAPAGELLAAAQVDSSLLEGFRKGHVPDSVVRTRLRARLAGQEGPRRLRPVLSDLSLHNRLIVVLSEKALRHGELNLARFFGPIQFYSSLLLDEREPLVDMADLALRRLQLSLDESTPDASAAERVKRDFEPFLTALSEMLRPDGAPGASRPPNAAATPQSSAAGITPAALKAAVLRAPTYLAMERRAQGAEASLKKKDDEVEAIKVKLEQACAEALTLEKQIQELNDGRAAEVQHQTAAALHNHLHRYFLEPVTPLSSQPSAPSAATLPEPQAIFRARAALTQQARLDQRYGRRSALVGRLEEARVTLHEVQEARLEALRASPDLLDAERNLRAYITQLEDSLKIKRASPQNPSDGYRKFLEGLRGVACLDDLVDRRQVIDAAELTGAWASEELQNAQEQMSETALRIYLEAGGRALPDKDLWRIGSASALGLFEIAVAQARPIRLLVDGHNVLHQLKGPWGDRFEGGQPARRAREHLTAVLDHLCRETNGLWVDLWYDGPVAENYTLHEQMRVLYSGGHGADRADQCIEASLQHLTARDGGLTSAPRVFVVSADRDVLGAAERYGAVGMRPMEMLGLVVRVEV